MIDHDISDLTLVIWDRQELESRAIVSLISDSSGNSFIAVADHNFTEQASYNRSNIDSSPCDHSVGSLQWLPGLSFSGGIRIYKDANFGVSFNNSEATLGIVNSQKGKTGVDEGEW